MLKKKEIIARCQGLYFGPFFLANEVMMGFAQGFMNDVAQKFCTLQSSYGGAIRLSSSILFLIHQTKSRFTVKTTWLPQTRWIFIAIFTSNGQLGRNVNRRRDRFSGISRWRSWTPIPQRSNFCPRPRSAGANTQTATFSFNLKSKTVNHIPPCHSSPYHTFIFQLHFGSGSAPVCTGPLSVTLWALTLSDSKQRATARSCPRPPTPPVSQMADSCDSSGEKKWPNVVTELSTATENYVAFENGRQKHG